MLSTDIYTTDVSGIVLTVSKSQLILQSLKNYHILKETIIHSKLKLQTMKFNVMLAYIDGNGCLKVCAEVHSKSTRYQVDCSLLHLLGPQDTWHSSKKSLD